MKKGKIIGSVLSAAMIVNCISPVMTAFAQTTGIFKDTLATVERTQSTEKFTAKPLVILIDFPDYRYTELDEKETDFRINSFSGEETTAEFYETLFFGDETYKTSDGNEHITVNKFFKEESGGTYEFKGKVTGWYTADHPAATYGANVNESDQKTARNLVLEAIQKASKDLDLSEFDIEDKWDLDCDGNYDEPDGIIDSLVVIHPGLGEEWGGGSLGEDAIWPFRWGFNVFGEDMDSYSSEERQAIVNKNHKVADKNGKEFFVEDFTIFEQDLPLDLFCHEFGHVLGLPDLYDTNSSEPPVENWSIMGGSYTGNPRGSQPVSYGAYCKEFLQKDFEKRNRASNWQNIKKVSLEDITAEGFDVVLDQATLKGKNKDTVRIDLPKYEERIVTPTEGNNCFFSGKGDKLENYMTTKSPIELAANSNAKLSFRTWYDIDPYFDFASVQVKEVGTDNWVTLKDETELTTDKVDPWIEGNDKDSIPDRNPGWGFTDTSNEKWLYSSFDLSQFKGKKFHLRFRFRTDDNTPQRGIYFDDIKIKEGSKVIFEDGAENIQNTKFDFQGFNINDGKDRHDHYYLLEWRSSGADTKVDKGLDNINIGAEGLSYETGLVMWYINGKYDGDRPDQNYNAHKGAVAVGVIDADQDPITYAYPNGNSGPDRLNYQLRDAAFSIRPDRQWLLDAGNYKVEDMHTFMNPIFKDSNDYTSPMWGSPTGLNLKNYGLEVFVTDESKDRSTAKIHIAKRNGSNDTTYSSQDTDMIREISIANGKIYITPKEQYSDKAYAAFSDLNGRNMELELKYENGKYVCDSRGISDSGLWKPEFIIFEDAVGNAKAVYNREANGIFGADLSKLFKKLEVEVDPEIKFVKGEKSKVSISVDLPNSIDEVTLLVGIYDKNGKMLGSSIKNQKVNGKTTLTSEIDVPNEENMTIKIMLWDLKTMKVLQRELVYNVK